MRTYSNRNTFANQSSGRNSARVGNEAKPERFAHVAVKKSKVGTTDQGTNGPPSK